MVGRKGRLSGLVTVFGIVATAAVAATLISWPGAKMDPVSFLREPRAVPVTGAMSSSVETAAEPASEGGTQPQLAQLKPAPPTSANQPQSTVDADVVFTLVRATLVAVDNANTTGNYTVLRDLGAPGFREANTAADLARIFASIRDAKVNLSAAVVLDPHIVRAAMTSQGMLDVAGSLQTRPVPVSFELLFQPIEGTWRIFGISVTPVQQASEPAGRTPARPTPKPSARAPSSRSKPTSPAAPKP